jgi:hypothetical protein
VAEVEVEVEVVAEVEVVVEVEVVAEVEVVVAAVVVARLVAGKLGEAPTPNGPRSPMLLKLSLSR